MQSHRNKDKNRGLFQSALSGVLRPLSSKGRQMMRQWLEKLRRFVAGRAIGVGAGFFPLSAAGGGPVMKFTFI